MNKSYVNTLKQTFKPFVSIEDKQTDPNDQFYASEDIKKGAAVSIVGNQVKNLHTNVTGGTVDILGKIIALNKKNYSSVIIAELRKLGIDYKYKQYLFILRTFKSYLNYMTNTLDDIAQLSSNYKNDVTIFFEKLINTKQVVFLDKIDFNKNEKVIPAELVLINNTVYLLKVNEYAIPVHIDHNYTIRPICMKGWEFGSIQLNDNTNLSLNSIHDNKYIGFYALDFYKPTEQQKQHIKSILFYETRLNCF